MKVGWVANPVSPFLQEGPKFFFYFKVGFSPLNG